MGEPGSAPSEAERQALRAVANLARLSEPLIFELWRSHELTLAQVQCLRILSQQREQAGELARKLSMSSTSLTRILERLESRGLIERTVDLHDRRRVWVHLTDMGRTTVGSLTSWYTSSLFRAIQEMDETSQKRLTEVLEHFVQRVRDIENADSPGPAWSEEVR